MGDQQGLREAARREEDAYFGSHGSWIRSGFCSASVDGLSTSDYERQTCGWIGSRALLLQPHPLRHRPEYQGPCQSSVRQHQSSVSNFPPYPEIFDPRISSLRRSPLRSSEPAIPQSHVTRGALGPQGSSREPEPQDGDGHHHRHAASWAGKRCNRSQDRISRVELRAGPGVDVPWSATSSSAGSTINLSRWAIRFGFYMELLRRTRQTGCVICVSICSSSLGYCWRHELARDFYVGLCAQIF